MMQKSKVSSRKFNAKKIFIWIIAALFVIVSVVGIYLYINFNRLLSNALKKSFEISIFSDVYDLSFDHLRVNFVLGNIIVKNFELKPKEHPDKVYPYINSSFKLNTKKILLTNVEILTLLNENKLKVESIEIDRPNIHLYIADVIPIFLPFNDSTFVSDTVQQSKKRPIEGFYLKQFNLNDASIHVENFAKERDLQITKVNIILNNLKLDQHREWDIFSYSHLNFYIGEINGSLQKESIKYINLKDYQIIIDSLEIQKSVDTFIYHFDDFKLFFKHLDMQTEDSISHIVLQDFDLSYSNKSVVMKSIAFTPNLSENAIQKQHKFQNTQFQGSAALIEIIGINFDSLFYRKKIFIDEIVLDSVDLSFFKDKTKPLDINRFPEYPAQLISSLKIPILVNQVSSTHVNIVYNEIKPDKNQGKANVNKANFKIENITNIDKNVPLSLKTDAFLENKVHFFMSLNFDYNKPEFNFSGSFPKFNLKDLNPLLQTFTPALINSGVADKIEFTGVAKKERADGTMKFLYNDLNFELNLEDKATWKNSVLSFAANTIVSSSNPASEALPPRIVKYHVERDMNKAFINITLISALAGLKETVFMSKENKERYKKAKKEMRKEIKASNK